MSIGSWNHDSGREFHGLLDEVEIYTSVLSPERIAEFHTTGRALIPEPTQDPQAPLAAYYPLDTGGENTAKPSQDGLEEPEEGGPQFVTEGEVLGGHVFLDGDDDVLRTGVVDIEDSLQLTTGGTIMAWFKQWDGDDYQRIVDKSDGIMGNNGYALIAHAPRNSIILCVDRNCYQTEARSYQIGKWTHVAAVMDLGSDPTDVSYQIYINGELSEDATLFRGHKFVRPVAVETEMSIGSWNHDARREFHGLLDEVQIYTSVLSAAEIADAHTTGRALITEPAQDPEAPLAAYYPLDTGGENTAKPSQHGLEEPEERGPQFVATGGVLDGHVSLDGDDDVLRTGVVDIEDSLQLTTGGTITAWFKQWDGDDYQRIVDKSDNYWGNNGYALFADPTSGRITLCVDRNCYQTKPESYQLEEWTHVAAVMDLGSSPDQVSYRIYINGKLSEGATLFRGHKFVRPVAVETELSIGSWNHTTGREFHGLLDEVQIYTSVLSAAEIADVMRPAVP